MTTSTTATTTTPENIAATQAAEFSLPERFKTNRKSPVRWLASHFWPYWWIGVLIVGGAIGNAALTAIIPITIGDAFNAILQEPPQVELLAGFFWVLVYSQAGRLVVLLFRNSGAEVLGQLYERNIREELYTSLLGKSMTFHNLQPVGDTMARATNDVREINFMFSPGLNLVVGSIGFMFAPLFLAPRYHIDLIWTPIVYLIAYVIALWLYLKKLQPLTDSVRGAFGKLNTRLAEAVDGIETVKGMAQEKSEVELFKTNARRFRDAFVFQGETEARFVPLLLLGVAQGTGLFHSLVLYQQGLITTGDVIAYFGILTMLGFPTFVSLFAYSQVSLGIASARRILELLNMETDLDQNLDGRAEDIQGAIEFKNISFSYNQDAPAVQDISFKVKPGQTVALVGQTGTGKTSLVKLVNRTYDVTEGQVLVDGVDVRDWQLESLRQQVSIIEQDIFLFSRTISENIAFGNPEATQAEIEEAAVSAQAHEFILDFKDGYQTKIGERGVTLSGGQRQRLALARAFLTDPRILVLDDSTSAIDSSTEDKIQRAIYNAAKGRTTLIITHRLSQIRWADLIVVMSKGKVSAVGSHEELLESSEAYQRIFNE